MYIFICLHAKSLQSSLTLFDPLDCSPPGSSVHGILQAKILQWVAIYSSGGSSWFRTWTCVSYRAAPAVQADSLPLSHWGSPTHTHTHTHTHVAVVQSLSCVQLFATSWTVACQASMSSTISQSLLKFMSIELVILSNHLILCHPFLLPSIFPSIKVFSNELALHVRWPKYHMCMCVCVCVCVYSSESLFFHFSVLKLGEIDLS